MSSRTHIEAIDDLQYNDRSSFLKANPAKYKRRNLAPNNNHYFNTNSSIKVLIPLWNSKLYSFQTRTASPTQ